VDPQRLKDAADILDRELQRAISNGSSEARALASAIGPVIAKAKAGQVVQALEWGAVPGSACFRETDWCRQYRSLEEAWADFKFEVTGGPPKSKVQ
jgi:hypothetical protein